MGKVRRGGYSFIWWKGDHHPRHVHVFDKNDKFVARVRLDTMRPLDTKTVDKKIISLIQRLQKEGRL